MEPERVQPFPEVARVARTSKGEENDELEHVQNYLARFGYLEEGQYETGKLDDPTSEALAKYQDFNAVPRTGEFDGATREAMTTDRCAMPDLMQGVEFATTCAWNQTEITFAFNNGTRDVAADVEFQAVRNAFETWAEVTPPNFREVPLDQNPDVVIDWRPANDPDHSMVGGTLAHADFPPGCSIIVDTLPLPVHFDDSEHLWSIGALVNAFDVETVALHELGHIIGLLHSDVAGAVMAPTVSSNFTKRDLTLDDRFGAESLYPGIVRRGDSDELAGSVREIAMTKLLTQQAITAVRTASNTLKLISWRVNDDGSVSRTGDSGDQAGVASHIDIARAGRHVTACRTSAGTLKLISWNISAAGAINRVGDSGNQAGTADLIKIIALSNTLLVTACRTGAGNLKLISWRLNNDGSLTRLRDSGDAAGTIKEVSLLMLAGGSTGGRVVTSVRDGAGNLKLIAWNVSASGSFSRTGDSGNQAGGATLIRSIMDSFGHVITSVRTNGGGLKLISWRVSADGMTVSRLADSNELAGEIGGNDLMRRPLGGMVSAVRTAEGNLKLIFWRTTAAGSLARVTSSSDQAGTASLITLCKDALSGESPVVTAVRTGEGALKLITWGENLP